MGKKTVLIYVLLIMILLSSPIIAQQDIQSIVTDRPDQTESPLVVPLDYFQIETGFIYQFQEFSEQNIKIENQNLTLASTLCRYGISSLFEFRFGGEYLYGQSYLNEQKKITQGFQNILLGAKMQIRKNQKYFSNVGIILQSILPFGNIALKPDRFLPQLIVCVNQNLADNYSLGVNIGLEDNFEFDKYSFIYTASLALEISNKVASFFEIYGDATNGFKPNFNIDCGLTYLHRENIQVDFSLGTAISDDVDWFGGFGISIRLPK
jgi:hypothetical protein